MEFLDEEVFKVVEGTMWTLYFDGSYTHNGSRVGILFVTTQGDYIPNSSRLAFPYTNNIAKYEALLTGLRVTIKWNITYLRVFDDSQLVIKQVNAEFLTKDEKLLPYKRMVDDFKKYFTSIQFD